MMPGDDSEDQQSAEHVSELENKLTRLRRKLKEARAELEAALGTPHGVSPLAPPDGFPALPVIDGVSFAAARAGVKYADRDDVMLVSISAGASIAGVFTRSSTRSAPVLDCEAKLAWLADRGAGSKGFAILVNSGNSNAFTGAAGTEAVAMTTSAVAAALTIPAEHVFSASTGVIGQPLPYGKITDVISQLSDDLSPDAAESAARAIMTTDTFAKGAVAEIEIDGRPVKIAGFAKGSGMIAPDMATMLVFLFTDASISQPALQKMLSQANRNTFNAITVDGDTSTSDSLILAATGKSGCEIGGVRSRTGKEFANALGQVMRELAHLVVRDGEGATKFVEVEVTGAATPPDARKVAMAIANSPLIKTAIAGEDPNWGRVVMAVGKSGARADRDRLTIRFGDILVAENGWVCPEYREEDGAGYMKQPEIRIAVDMGIGSGSFTAWTCDLTKQYIAINADYRS
ncbi:MAG: bifunctional glutamate N-acetyltransferase/amino-acid acetyltransferase ArgJ [Rhodobacteraceae bacterium]|nr:bifunctional glutamate N-acetyltransferase/amino-acid acetyltransferase ArgJ [Paracoccaceae bacterium]